MTLSAGARLRARYKAQDAQPAFPGVIESVNGTHLARIERFVADNRRRYVDMALAIQPDLTDWRQVWDRVAWAILTANAEYGACREAMRRVERTRAGYDGVGITRDVFKGLAGMTPAKIDYLNALPRHSAAREYLTISGTETWDAYRLRLRRDVKGLELTKASYAATMLYPMTADVACLDTWVQKAFTWTTRFRSLPLAEYRRVEAEVRAIARRHDVSTALCQWMIWDCVRGTTTDQRVFVKWVMRT